MASSFEIGPTQSLPADEPHAETGPLWRGAHHWAGPVREEHLALDDLLHTVREAPAGGLWSRLGHLPGACATPRAGRPRDAAWKGPRSRRPGALGTRHTRRRARRLPQSSDRSCRHGGQVDQPDVIQAQRPDTALASDRRGRRHATGAAVQHPTDGGAPQMEPRAGEHVRDPRGPHRGGTAPSSAEPGSRRGPGTCSRARASGRARSVRPHRAGPSRRRRSPP